MTRHHNAIDHFLRLLDSPLEEDRYQIKPVLQTLFFMARYDHGPEFLEPVIEPLYELSTQDDEIKAIVKEVLSDNLNDYLAQ